MTATVGEIELYCPSCGYDLRASPSGACPECGQQFDRGQLSLSTIPWEHRSRIGLRRAFGRTVMITTFRLKRLRQECARAVSYPAAQRFRWMVVLLVWAACAFVLGVLRWQHHDEIASIQGSIGSAALAGPGWTPRLTPLDEIGMCVVVGWTFVATPFVSLLVLLIGLSGVGSYFFHPRSLPVARQNRAVAVSYYACGPQAMIAPGAILLFSGAQLLKQDAVTDPLWSHLAAVMVAAIGGGFILIGLLTPVINIGRLLRWSTHCSTVKAWVVGGLYALLCCIVALIALVVIPAVVGFLVIVVDSLRA